MFVRHSSAASIASGPRTVRMPAPSTGGKTIVDFRHLVAASAALLASSSASAASAQASPDAALEALAQQRVALQISYNPAAAYALGVPTPDHRRWPDRSQSAIAAFQRQLDIILADLGRIDPARLTTPQRRSIHAGMLESLEAEKQTRICQFHLWAVSHVFGWHASLGNVANAQPVSTAQDRVDALARWSALPTLIDQEIANARLGL